MKLRIIKTTPEHLTQLLLGKASAFPRLPADIEVLDAKMDLFTKQVSIVVRSDSFEDIAENQPIPEISLGSSPEIKMAPKPLVHSPTKTETAPTPKPSITLPLIPKPTQPPASRYAAKMENEFSPEQRKLLSFTVKGNIVVVKPVQFLKAEWEDINEVVRSLGGKWVKGDIISYWEIPLQ